MYSYSSLSLLSPIESCIIPIFDVYNPYIQIPPIDGFSFPAFRSPKVWGLELVDDLVICLTPKKSPGDVPSGMMNMLIQVAFLLGPPFFSERLKDDNCFERHFVVTSGFSLVSVFYP